MAIRAGARNIRSLRRSVSPAVRSGDDVVHLQRLVHHRVPFLAGGGTAAAAFRQRQIEGGEQRAHLLAGGDVRQAWPHAEHRGIEFVERGEATREELAIDDALGETVHMAEAETFRQFQQALPDQLLVARRQRREAVAHHDPVGQRAVDQPALAARLAHHAGIVALAVHREGGRIERTEHVEIDEAVVDRRDQRVGHRMREPHQIGVGAGRIDHNHVVGVLDRGDGAREAVKLRRLVGVDRGALGAADAIMRRQFERNAGARGPAAAVLDIMGEALLAAVEIDGRDPLPGLEQGHGDMQRGRGFARAALLVAENDDMSGVRFRILVKLIGQVERHSPAICWPKCPRKQG